MNDIVIKGGYGLRNFGDDALMYYLVKSIQDKYPDLSIALDCERQDYIKKFLPDIAFSKPFEIPRRAYVYGGGTLYYSFPKPIVGKSMVTKLAMALRNPELVVNKLLAKSRYDKFVRSNVPKIMFGLGFGPFYQENQQYFKAIEDVKAASDVYVRDSVSYEFVNGLTNNAVLGTDICFAQSVVNVPVNNNKSSVRRIGIIVRDWNYGTQEDHYKEHLIIAVEQLRSEGYEVQYVVFSDLRDHDWLMELRSQNENILMWNPDTQTIEGFMDVLKTFDMFISARFHGVIFSTLLNKPSVSIALEPKLELVTENAICKTWHPINDSCEDVLAHVSDINANYSEYVSKCSDLTKQKSKVYNEMLLSAFGKI